MKKKDLYLVIFLVLIVLCLFLFLQYNSSLKFRENMPESYDQGLNWTVYKTYHNENVNFASSFQVQTDSNTGSPMQGKGTIDLSSLDKMTNGAIQEKANSHGWSMELVGFFIPPSSGNWLFQTSSNQGSYLWIGDSAIQGWTTDNATVNNGGQHTIKTVISQPIPLEAGKEYPIRIQAGCRLNQKNHFQVQWMLQSDGTWSSDGSYCLYNMGAIDDTQNDHIYSAVHESTIVNGSPDQPKNVNKNLLGPPATVLTNWAVSFTVNLQQGAIDNWQQILGITPSSSGDDQRTIGIWIQPTNNQIANNLPDGNYIYIQTATQEHPDGFDTILDGLATQPLISLDLNTNYRFDIVSNTVEGQQIISTYQTNLDRSSIKNHAQPISTVQLSLPLYSNTPAYIFTSFNNFTTITGTVSNVVFVTGNSPIYLGNLINATNKLNKTPSPTPTLQIDQFTNIKESYRGMGDTSGVKLSTDTITSNSVQNVTDNNQTNYVPIGGLCTKSSITTTDSKLSILDNKGNFGVSIGSDLLNAGTVPICSPDDLYAIQNQVLKELNQFNAEYSDFMTYKYNSSIGDRTVTGNTKQYIDFADGTPGKNYTDTKYNKYSAINNVNNLSTYNPIVRDLQTYTNLLTANKAYYPDPIPGISSTSPTTSMSTIDPVLLAQKHEQIIKTRNELDTKLFELNNVQNSSFGDSKRQMDSSVYVTILWTTLATSLVYYLFVKM